MLTSQEQMGDVRPEPEVDYTSAVEWSTLQEATNVRQTRQEPIRTWDDEWGGKVWDGVTDWFV